MSRPVCAHRTGRRTETSYKAESPDKSAQHVKALGSGDTVNAAAVQWKFTFLSGETCLWCGIDSCLVRLPAGATGTQMSRHLLEGLLPEDEIRTQGKQTGQGSVQRHAGQPV